MCTQMFTAALFLLGKEWKQPTCLSTHEWISEWNIHTMEYYSAIERNGIQLCATGMDEP